jgi:predicted nucleotidyltransferase
LVVQKIIHTFAAQNNKRDAMSHEEVLDRIKGVAASVLPLGSTMYLYGSRARGEAKPDSDWDLLILLNRDKLKRLEAEDLTFPFTDMGWDIGEDISARAYTRQQWEQGPHTMFYYNVEQDKKKIYES